MKILFIHQNFPGQFKHLAPALAGLGHETVALTLRVRKATRWNGVKVLPYQLKERDAQNTHRWLVDFDTKLTRAEACYHAAVQLRDQGFTPDLIIAHPGWGESLFLKDVWPKAKLAIYCELYHKATYPHTAFDPEFQPDIQPTDVLRLRLKNLNNHQHFEISDAGISPTRFQADTFPPAFRDKITICHDGIRTDLLTEDPNAQFTLPGGQVLTRADELVTFVNRNLEPYRGYHIFMRALPELLKARPKAQILIVGGEDVSYGARPPKGQSWKQIFIDEVRPKIPDTDWARVHFLGRIPYEPFQSLLKVSRVHIYLTYPFVLSWSLFETMSVKGAIVASKTPPVEEAITHGVQGKLVDFFDKEALVAEVCTLLDNEEERATLGAAARDLIVRNYDLTEICLPRQLDWVMSL
ncbi:glycosyltransferase family 4 protein [uncultured Lentibacter sp.]|uniref:glycosyltransferase family 4 protein n=1 Tax=uncultured Lentibacter sp. TaxID=1659309 RepID=UPI002609001F|nr:glycosyltransferase family 4 protein [uncultured Lentibacter sp.]